MKQLAIIIGLLSTLLLGISLKPNAKEVKKHKIVFQLSTADTITHKGFIKQLNNVKNGIEAEVEVVVLGPGIQFLRKNKANDKAIQQLHSRGVKLLVCRNTMREKKVSEEELYSFVEVVPMGIGHIVKRQEEGWSYIKAGF